MTRLPHLVSSLCVAVLIAGVPPAAAEQQAPTVDFHKGALAGTSSDNPTQVEFGPDGRLYVAQQDGRIKAYTIVRDGVADYRVTATETIEVVHEMQNHNDDGAPSSVTGRLLTSLRFSPGSSQAFPEFYVLSSDPRIGGGNQGTKLAIDTNSGVLSRVRWNGGAWERHDVVRGLPRSLENHHGNAVWLDETTDTAYLAYGGNTNHGAPSNNFAGLPEFALSAAILSVDLDAIGSGTYDLPTLQGTATPWGGKGGSNQARLVPDGPVQVHAPGFRNAYDLVVTTKGHMFTVDNGGNAGWGGPPHGEGPGGGCTNEISEPGASFPDTLHRVTPGYYGGHPNPTRGNMANTFGGLSPVSQANPVECDFRSIAERGALFTYPTSTNGLVEYRASNFGGALQGDLLATSFDNAVWRMQLDEAGTGLDAGGQLLSNVGQIPLGIDALGDQEAFPGTVWVTDHVTDAVHVYEPTDYDGAQVPPCTGVYSWQLSESGTGYSNADMIDNGLNPCSGASTPPDFDGDGVSDLNDPDDDGDGVIDAEDPFPWDADNGLATDPDLDYRWDNEDRGLGGLLDLGFTGLMSNGTTEYSDLFDPDDMTVRGAGGVVTVDAVPAGDARTDDQAYAFQLGVDARPSAVGYVEVRTRVVSPFAGVATAGTESMGLFLGTGTQDDYVKVVVVGGDGSEGSSGVAVATEVDGAHRDAAFTALDLSGVSAVDLFLVAEPSTGRVEASFRPVIADEARPRRAAGDRLQVPPSWFAAQPVLPEREIDGSAPPQAGGLTGEQLGSGLAVGIIATAGAEGQEFPATWEDLAVRSGAVGAEPPRPDPDPSPDPLLTRLSGADRLQTAIAISRDGYEAGQADVVVLARADIYPDALAGAALAHARGGPLLLSPSTGLTAAVAAEIERALPEGGEVVLLGGTSALGPAVAEELAALGYRSQRIAGRTRVETSLAIADAMQEAGPLLVTTGSDFPDALAAGAAAANVGGAVLLVNGEEPHPAVTARLEEAAAQVYAIGGPAERAYPEATSLVGATREETAVAVAEELFDGPSPVGLARRDTFPDALAGGAHIAARGGPMLLTPSGGLHPAVRRYLCTSATNGFIYGGDAAISDAALAAGEAAIAAGECS